MIRKQDALDYHAQGRKGKLEITVTKPCSSQRDLSLAYTPGVADPCREIHLRPDDAYLYTAKGNLVACVSNGTAVLGLGNIGALAAKPVMEGKAVLFKRFADIDVFDIELDLKDPDAVVATVLALEPTFGGINLEDIKAPECFYIEDELKKRMGIPVFHDDQHGTAIISGAALLNAVDIAGKRMEDTRIVVCGAGAAGIACANLYCSLGVKAQNVFLVDSKGIVFKGRVEGMNPYKEKYARDTPLRTLADAMRGADVFVGVSGPGLLTPEMVRSMADRPVVFAMANPDPEITYEDAKSARGDVLVATGRSDFPNQVNNVLGFPYIFRGALDVRATCVNEEMKIAAVRALAALAKEDVPDSVISAYSGQRLRYGPDYIIPKPFDPRVLTWVAPAVAKAAMESNVAGVRIDDFEEYQDRLEARLGKSREISRVFIHKAKQSPRRIVFTEGEEDKILRASQIIIDEKIAEPILLGRQEVIQQRTAALGLELDGVEIVDPLTSPKLQLYTERFYEMRQRRGVTQADAGRLLKTSNIFGMMMLRMGDAAGLVSGLTQHLPETIRPALQIIKLRPGVRTIAGVYMLLFKTQTIFIADATVNIDPTAEQLAEIAILTAHIARRFGVEPRVAMLSFSNFGSTKHPLAQKASRAVEIVRSRAPSLLIDGEMTADIAVVPELLNTLYPFNELKGGASVLVFPDLCSANVSYRLLSRMGGAVAIGPLLTGMNKPVYLLQMISDVNDIVNMTALAVVEARDSDKLDPLLFVDSSS